MALADEVALALMQGEIGTYALFFEPGYLLQATALDTKALQIIENAVAQQVNGYHVPPSPNEQALLKTYRALPTEDKDRLRVIAEALKGLAVD